MPFTEEDLRDAQVNKLHAEISAIGKRPWQSHTYWIAIFTALAALSSTVWQFFRSDTEYKLAELKRLQTESAVISLKSEQDDLQKKRDALTADIASRNTQLSTLTTQITSLKAELGERTAELASQVTLNKKLQEEVVQGLKQETAVIAQRLIDAASKRGIEIRIISGYRSPEDQAKLAAQNLARTKKSVHTTGLAFDVGVFKNGAYVPEDPAYDIVGQIGKELGLLWGGDWKTLKDQPHFQTQNADQVLQNPTN
jgi:hypothetical protein